MKLASVGIASGRVSRAPVQSEWHRVQNLKLTRLDP